MSEAIEDVRATLNDLFSDVKGLAEQAEQAAREAAQEVFRELAIKMRDAKTSLKSSIDAVEEQLAEEPQLDEMIDESAVIELVEAVRDGDRAHALRMLERVFESDVRLLAAVQQATFERPRLAA